MSGAAPPSDAGGLTAARGVPTIRRWLGPLLNVPTPAIFVVAAAIASALLWRRGALGQVGSSLRGADPRIVAAIMLVYAASSLAQSARWHALVRMVGGQPPWAASAEVFLTSVIVNYAAPIGLAVPTRAALTVRDLGLKRGPSAAVVGWEAGLDVAALALISALWLIGSGPTLFLTIGVNGREVGLVVAAGAGLVLAVLVASKTTTLGTRLAGPARLFLAYPGERPRLALLATLLTLAYWCGQSMVMASLLKIFGVAATPSLVLGVMGLPVLIGMLSPVPGGAGVREGLMAAVARLAGIPVGPVVLAAVTYRLILFVVTPLVWALARAARSLAAR